MKKKYKYQVTYLDKENDYKCSVKYYNNLICCSNFIKSNNIECFCIIDMETLNEVDL